MPEFAIVTTKEAAYIFQDGSSSMDPNAISAAMGSAFGAVAAFADTAGISQLGKALSVYTDYDPKVMRFRAGFIVSSEDAEKAHGETKADVLPATRALNFVHTGPYSTLRVSYGEMMQHLESAGLKMGEISWEVYLNEPDEVLSEDELRTDVYVALLE